MTRNQHAIFHKAYPLVKRVVRILIWIVKNRLIIVLLRYRIDLRGKVRKLAQQSEEQP